MTARSLNAAMGFCAGSAAYFAFLFAAPLVLPSSSHAIYCFAGFWRQIVFRADLTPRLQPHYLYLCALLGAFLFVRIVRPFRKDVPLHSIRVAALGWSICTVVAINLWFAVSLTSPRLLHL